MTDYHDYSTPAEGTTDWHIPLNSNFEKIDADTEIRDIEKNLANYPPKQNAKFLATDTGRIYLCTDGSEWTEMGSISGDGGGGTGSPDVIVAKDASEIQPAIDKLTSEISYSGAGDDGRDIRGGVVQLLPKPYYPTDTIELKRGVIVQGTSPNPQKEVFRSGGANESYTTTIFTSEMPTGSAYALDPSDGAHSYRHFDTTDDHRDFDEGKISSNSELRAVTHPHLPVFVWKNQLPIYTGRDPTEEERHEWGHYAGIRNLLLFADQQRYWDPNDESAGSEARREATYYGVYDAFLMENVHSTMVHNVATANFLGYNGFYQDVFDVTSIGNHYGANGVGSATDHHGSTLTLDYSFRHYVQNGMWNVDVTGPTPTVKASGHLTEKFVGDGPVKGVVEGKEPVYLGSESDYDSGYAPIVEPDKKNVVFDHRDQHTEMWDYTIRGHDNTIGTAVEVDDNNFRAFDTKVSGAKDLFRVRVSDFWLRDCTLVDYTGVGVMMNNHTPHLIEGTEIGGRSGSVAVWADNTTNGHGGLLGCVFNGDTGFQANNGAPRMFANDCNFVGLNSVFASQPTEWNGKLQIADPYGYANEGAGNELASGDGTKTSFTIATALDEEPVWYSVDPASADASDNFYATTNGTDLIVNYHSAPPSGTDNLSWVWNAKGWSAPGVAEQP